jgi:hypothetical protein
MIRDHCLAPENAVHVLMSQMQVAFIGVHNLLVDRLIEDGVAEAPRARETGTCRLS